MGETVVMHASCMMQKDEARLLTHSIAQEQGPLCCLEEVWDQVVCQVHSKGQAVGVEESLADMVYHQLCQASGQISQMAVCSATSSASLESLSQHTQWSVELACWQDLQSTQE